MARFFHLDRNRLPVLISLMLALITTVVYFPVGNHEFISFDDQQYITENVHIQNGVTWDAVRWAFTTGYASNWHPLTWISHMLDCQLYGLQPGGHHLTNVILHAATTVLIFLWLWPLTGALWRSAFVAAFFAWHPLHVESVAWAAERKDVLCAFFWMLTLLAYTGYVRRKNWRNYALVLFLFALALLAKPMAVTLPCALLLIDFWPLKRLALPDESKSSRKIFLNRLLSLAWEKAPLFALSAAASIVTYVVQDKSGATWSFATLPPQARIANALLGYYRYVSKTFWPTDLAVIYPHPGHWPWLLVSGVAVVLVAWIGIFLWRSQQQPYLLMGWLWFLGTLVPTIGLVQVGSQSIADRYTYIPSIGLFIIIVWGACDLARRSPRLEKFLPVAGAVCLAGCLAVTSVQLSHWQNSIKLFLHTINVTTDNFVALNSLGGGLRKIGRDDDAIKVFQESVRIQSHYPPSLYNLAVALLENGRSEEAFKQFDLCVQLMPNRVDLRYDYARYLMQNGRYDDARTQIAAIQKLQPDYAEAYNLLGSVALGDSKQSEASDAFEHALKLKPDFAEAHLNLGLLAVKQKDFPGAIAHFSQAVRLVPDNPETHFNLGLAYLDNHEPAKAEVEFMAQLHLAPREAKGRYRLAQAFQQQGRFSDAAFFYREALAASPNFADAQAALAEILAAHPELKSNP